MMVIIFNLRGQRVKKIREFLEGTTIELLRRTVRVALACWFSGVYLEETVARLSNLPLFQFSAQKAGYDKESGSEQKKRFWFRNIGNQICTADAALIGPIRVEADIKENLA